MFFVPNPDPSGEWLQIRGDITMAQAQSYGVVSSIWDLYEVCSTARKQLLDSHHPQHPLYPCSLAILLQSNSDPSGVIAGAWRHHRADPSMSDVFHASYNTNKQWDSISIHISWSLELCTKLLMCMVRALGSNNKCNT